MAASISDFTATLGGSIRPAIGLFLGALCLGSEIGRGIG